MVRLFSIFEILYRDILRLLLYGAKRNEGTADKAARDVLPNCISCFIRPDIILSDRDSRFVGSEFARFRNGKSVTLQTVIPGRHQSLGATEMGHMYFKDITTQTIDKGE